MSMTPQQKAEAAVQPYASFLQEIVTDAYAKWLARPENWQVGRATRAIFMWEEMGALAKARYAAKPGLNVVERHRVVHLLTPCGGYDLRFKKLGDDGSVRFNRTGEQLSLFSQLPLPGINTRHLVVGYLLNADETSVERVEVGYFDNASEYPAWSFDLAAHVAPTTHRSPDVLPVNTPTASATITVKQPAADSAVAGE